MLVELRIRNLAVIDELAIEFGSGLNILTGETGAGKSIILNALGLVLGDKAGAHLIRTGEDSARVDAVFAMDMTPATQQFLADAAIAVDDDEIVITRIVHSNGRSRALINGQMTTNAVLAALGESNVDLHGQHEHQSLFRVHTHLELLDAFAGVRELRVPMAVAHGSIQARRRQLRELQMEAREALREREFVEHEVAELDSADVREGEDEELDAERRRLANAERLHKLAQSAYARLCDDPGGAALEQVRIALADLQDVAELDETAKESATRLEALYYELEDLGHEVRDYRNGIEFNASRLNAIEERLQLIFQLKRKYGMTIADIVERREASTRRLERWRITGQEIKGAKRALRDELVTAGEIAFELSERRRESAKQLEARVEEELAALDMAKARFQVVVAQRESESGLIRRGEKSYKLNEAGLDDVEFLIAPNVGEEARPLNRIASGGEISRTMLALKTVLSELDDVPTLLFDEVDSGIGGDTATIVGRKLRRLAEHRQVVCITHLPQIAALADFHFRVEKRVDGEGSGARTRTVATALEHDARVAELSRMLGGETDASRALAHRMLASSS